MTGAGLFGLALADLRHEWPITLCIGIGVAASLAPLLILFGLKYGLVTGLLTELREDPRTREIRLVGQGRFEPAWFTATAARPDVAFVIPMTRFLTASIDVTTPDSTSEPVMVELFPTADGDPLLAGFAPPPGDPWQVVVTSQTAEALSLRGGDRLVGEVGRLVAGRREVEKAELTVLAVLPPGRLQRRAAFVALPFLTAVEAYREGTSGQLSEALDSPTAGSLHAYASFRLYARSVYDVAGLRDWFAEIGLEVVTDAPAIDRVIRLDRSLTRLFGIVSGLAGIGLLLTMGLGLWASVSRKRRELSVLRLLGYSRAAVALYPVLQAIGIACLGALVAFTAYVGAQPLIRRSLPPDLGLPGGTSGLEPRHLLIAFAATLLTCGSASALAGWRAARISVPEGLRDG